MGNTCYQYLPVHNFYLFVTYDKINKAVILLGLSQ